MSIEYIATVIPVTDEDIVDYAIGTPELQRAAADRLDVGRAELRAYWQALPWWTRLARTVRPRLWGARYRVSHAFRALRGHDCERDC